MEYVKPTLVIISGPNGAGKSTHIQDMLPSELENINSFDRDLKRTEFEKSLGFEGIPDQLIPERAVALMESGLTEAMDKAIGQQAHFVLETPLSHPDYWRYIDRFTDQGYQVELFLLYLDSFSDSLDRVRQRVMMGGHQIDPKTMKGVYEKNLEYINDYRDTFVSIGLYDGMKLPKLLARIENDTVIYINENPLKKNWIKRGLPALAKKILDFQMSKKPRIKKSRGQGI